MDIYKTLLLSAIALLIAVCNSYAQTEQSSKPLSAAGHTYYPQRYEYDIIPITAEIIADLNLTRPQIEGISKNNRRGIRADPPYPNAQKEDYEHILLLLNSEQKRRLEQLKLQHVGALRAFLIPQVKLNLNITQEQYETLAFLFRAYANGISNLSDFEKLYLGQDNARGRYGKALLTAADRMAESVLTAEQHLKWVGLQGRLLDPLPTIWR